MVFTKIFYIERFRDPTAVLDDDVNIKWPSLKESNDYMMINKELSLQKDVFKERVAFWAQLFEGALGDYIKLFL